MNATAIAVVSDSEREAAEQELRLEWSYDYAATSGQQGVRIEWCCHDGAEWVRASVDTSRGEQYSRRCTWHKTDQTLRVVVSAAGWRRRAGLAVVDRLVTLWRGARAVRRQGVTVWQAVWLEQDARGKGVHHVSGWIGAGEWGGQAVYSHGESVGEAVRGVRGKVRKLQREARGLDAARIVRVLQVGPAVPVAWGRVGVMREDSIAAGNCEAGTRSFVAQHRLRGAAVRAGRLLEIGQGRLEVVRAVAQAILRAAPGDDFGE